VTAVDAQWFAPITRLGVALDETPRLASWNAATDPDQEALQSYLRAAEQKLVPSLQQAAAPQTLRLDVGLLDETLLLEHRDLDNYLYPLAAHLSKRPDVDLVSVVGTKRHAGRSFLAVEPSRPTEAPDAAITVRTTASASSVAFKEQIRDQVGARRPLPEGPVHLEVAFVVGPRRNWLNLWKPTIDALGGLLGLEGTAPWNPRDGRITRLALHRAVDDSMGDAVTISIHAQLGDPGRETAELWRAVVEARRELVAREAAFHQLGQQQVDVLVAALAADRSWDWHTALHYLSDFPERSEELTDALVREVESPRGSGWAVKALLTTPDRSEVARRVLARLPACDSLEWRWHANLLWSIKETDGLAELLARARDSQDPDLHELVEDYREMVSPLVALGPAAAAAEEAPAEDRSP